MRRRRIYVDSYMAGMGVADGITGAARRTAWRQRHPWLAALGDIVAVLAFIALILILTGVAR